MSKNRLSSKEFNRQAQSVVSKLAIIEDYNGADDEQFRARFEDIMLRCANELRCLEMDINMFAGWDLNNTI